MRRLVALESAPYPYGSRFLGSHGTLSGSGATKMHIGVCTIELRLPGNGSLKGKRRVIKSVVRRIGREFNVSIAEVDAQNLWQRAVLGVACVSPSSGYAHGQLERVVQWIEANRLDVELLEYHIELL